MAARFQYAENLADHFVFVRAKVQNAIADDYISGIAGYRHIFNITLAELHVIETANFRIFSCLLYHGGCEVDADHFAGCSSLVSCDKNIISRAATKVNYYIPFPD